MREIEQYEIIGTLVSVCNDYRSRGDFVSADEIRGQLEQLGIDVRNEPIRATPTESVSAEDLEKAKDRAARIQDALSWKRAGLVNQAEGIEVECRFLGKIIDMAVRMQLKIREEGNWKYE